MSIYQNVMMVCIGNICRSPIAEVYLKHHHPDLNVYSSGLGAMIDWPADQNSVAVMADKGIDLSQHRAQQINAELVSQADLILVMEHDHHEAIINQYHASLGKVHLIGKWNDNEEIADPYLKDLKEFETIATMIESGIDAWRKQLWA